MKNIYILSLLLIPNIVFGQTSQNNLSTIETFINEPGKYITYDFTDVGRVKAFSISIITAKNKTDNIKMNGLLIKYENSTGLQMEGYIDENELSTLVKTLQDLQLNVFKNPPVSINAGAYFSGYRGLRIGAAVVSVSGGKVWSPYVAFDSVDIQKRINTPMKDFDALLKLLENAKMKLGIN